MRNKFFILLAAIMLSATLGLSSVSAATFERTLSVGSTGPDVSVLQQILKNLGYFTYSAITGYFGPVTQTAVQAFQAAKNIVSSGTPETTGYGVVGPQTRSVLNAIAGTATTTPVAIADSTIFARDLEVGMTGDDVAALQRFLNAHGFLIASAGAGSSGNETNYFGPATQAALIRFQAANNIQPAAGYFGPLTRAKTAELSTAGSTAAGSASSLAAPASLTIEKTRSYEIVLSWSAVDGASSYTVERKGDNDASWKVIASGITATTYTDTTVQTDEDYSYIIVAVNAKGAGSPSQSADATARTPKSVRSGGSSGGNSGGSSSDTTPPTVSVAAPTDGDTVYGSDVALVANFSDDTGVEAIQFAVDGTMVGPEVTSLPYMYAWDSTAVSNGAHTITATARDTAGNVATSSSITVTVDNSDAGLSMAQLPADEVFQRLTTTGGTYGKGTGSIPVTIALTSDAHDLECRLRDASAAGNPVLKDWFVATTSAPDSSTSVTCPDVPARLGWYYVDVRANGDDGQTVLGTSPVAMGRVVVAAGQSLAVRMFGRMDSQTATDLSLGVATSSYGVVYATYEDTQRSTTTPVWSVPNDGTYYDSTFAAEFLRQEVSAAGVPVALVGHAHGAQPISTFLPGQTDNTELRSILSDVGGFEAFIWFQGHSDAEAGTDASTYQSALDDLFADATDYNGVRGSSYEKYVGTIPNIDSTSWGTSAQIRTIRSAASAWAASNSATYVQPEDLDLVDGVHETQLGGIALADHFYRATRPALGLSHSDIGPSITSGARASGSKDIVLSVSLPSGASTLVATGSPASRFTVFTSGTTSSALALDNTTPITVGTNTITLHLATAPSDGTALDVYAFYPPDSSHQGEADMIYDDDTDNDGIANGRQLVATLSPIVVAAPSPSAPSNTVLPAITGTAQVGQTLLCSTGTWDNGPSGYAYQWNWDDTTAAISGAIGSSYAPVSGDVGHTLSCAVTATNTAGSTTATSSPTSSVAAASLTHVGPDLTMTSDTYATGATNFGQEITGGYGLTANTTDNIPSANTWTIEGRLSLSSAPASVVVAFGQGGKGWIGVASDGRLIADYQSAGGDVYIGNTTTGGGGTNPVISDGSRHHIALVASSTGATLYIDGTAVGTSSTVPATGVGNSPFGVHTFGLSSSSFVFPGTLDEVAIWDIAKYTTDFTPTITPYVGNESGLVDLWHLDGDGTAATY